jgi:alkanesulfonate monooxygenase SsuD/methylene tetrahydromethanopterin reductase-like flavin-dependent oxidoreductase (luciferase family)
MGPPETTQTAGPAPVAGSSVGAGVTPFQTDADATIRLAVRAEELGYARFGTAEGWTHDAVVLLTQIAGVTSRIGLGTGVLPVWSRTPAAIAMAAAGLQRASGGRFALGLGASSPPLVEGLHGMTWEQPVNRIRTTLVAVRALLEGKRLPLDREGVRALRLGAPPERRVPILLAALAPASVRLAGELADYWLPFLWARSRLPDGRALLAEGEARAETRPVSQSVFRWRSPRTMRRPGRLPLVGCSPTSHGWVRCIRGCSEITSDSRRRSTRCSAPTPTVDPRGCPRPRRGWLEM